MVRSLETHFFKKDYRYNNKFINRCILIIQFSKNKKRVAAYKNYVFRMMKTIVRKNSYNYINLIRNSGVSEVPEFDDLIVECFLMFDKCAFKYKVRSQNNFYFYYNKSLSRTFYKMYQKESRMLSVEITEAVATINTSLRSEPDVDTIPILLETFNFTEEEKRVIYSRLNGQKSSEFLENNPDICGNQYSRILRNVKKILSENLEHF